VAAFPDGATDGVGKCVTLAHKGQACTPDRPCWFSLSCNNGVCAAADPVICPG
jgi:hypothetical protein